MSHSSLFFKVISIPGVRGARAIQEFLKSIHQQLVENQKVAMKVTIADEAQPIDVDPETSKGSFLVDAITGKEYLNFHGGFGADALGMNHPSITPELITALGKTVALKMAHADFRTTFSNAASKAIYELLAAPSGFVRMYFTDGGSMANSEAVWACIYTKTKLNLSQRITVKADAVMALKGAFHGRNGTGASLTEGNPKIAGHPQLPNFEHVPRPDFTPESIQGTLSQIKTYCQNNPHKLAAFIVEDGIQCEAGDKPIPKEFYVGLRKLADQYGFYVIYDAVQTGFYSTGHAFAYQAIDAPAPDIVTGSKKSSLGYVFAGERIMRVKGNAFVAPGIIDSTWFGNSSDYVMMAAKLLIIKAEKLDENASVQGEKLVTGLKKLAQEFPKFIKEARGIGLVDTLEFHTKEDCFAFIDIALAQGLMVLASRNPNVVRIRPNLAITDEEVALGLKLMKQTLLVMSGALKSRL